MSSIWLRRNNVRSIDITGVIPDPAVRNRIDGGAGSGKGSGLGLAIAKGFIEANGGEIEVESLPGQGSSFVITFDAPEVGAEEDAPRPVKVKG